MNNYKIIKNNELSKKEKNRLVLDYIKQIKTDIGKNNVFIGDILNYFEKQKIGIFNNTRSNITIAEYIIRNYLKLDKEIEELSIHNKTKLVKLFFEFNLLK